MTGRTRRPKLWRVHRKTPRAGRPRRTRSAEATAAMSVAHPTEPAGTADTETAAPPPRPGPRRGRRLVKIVVLSVAVLLVVVIGGIYLTGQRFTGQVHRFSGVFAGLDEASRPPATAAKT